MPAAGKQRLSAWLTLFAALSTAQGQTASAREPRPEAPADTREAGPETGVDAKARAKQLYEAGTVLYSASNYAGAIEKFTEALAIIAAEPEAFGADTRGLLLYNLATAHDRAFNIDNDLSHLRAALDLYERIINEAQRQGYSESLAAQAQEAKQKVRIRLDEAQASAPQPNPAPAQTEPTPPPPDRSPRRLTIAGAVVGGIGIAASSIWISGVALGIGADNDIDELTAPSDESARTDAIDRGGLGNDLAIAGAIISAALVVTGAVLIAVGQTRKRKSSNLACGPTGCRIAF